MTKTATVAELRDSLAFLESNDDEEPDTELPASDIDEDQELGSLCSSSEGEDSEAIIEEESKMDLSSPLNNKLEDRIKLLRHRWVAGIGSALFEQAYAYLQTKNSFDPDISDQIRLELKGILGASNIGFWSLID